MIRTATVDDIPALTTLGAMFLAEPHYARLLGTNTNALAEYMRRFIEGPTSAILIDIERDDVIGMLAVHHGNHPMSGQHMAAEAFWYVHPDHRGRRGLALMHHAEQWARAHGAKQFQMTAPNDRVARIYEHRGFEAVEMCYQKELL